MVETILFMCGMAMVITMTLVFLALPIAIGIMFYRMLTDD